MVKVMVEDNTGHSEKEVPEKDIQAEVEKELQDNKWVTTEKEDGSTEILTKADIPATDEDKAWAEKFENVTSVTATNKVRGG